MTMDTIVAAATPPGRGGVGIIRLSGPNASFIAMTLSGDSSLPIRKAHYRSFYHNDVVIDQGLLLYFKAPHSFTGEDVVELQVHGAPLVLDQLISACVQLGARLARPGEFSERAFLNDKMDLVQAEAIADLIHATSLTAAKMAMRSLQGEFSKKINELAFQITQLRLFVEAAIDFPEEEIDFLKDHHLVTTAQTILSHIELIRQEANQGVILREGLSVVIVGRPNAGKSTLINRLAGRDVAIVTDVPGTTRDILREHIVLDDIPLYIMDTAGLRESIDPVEQEGIKRAWAEMTQADCVIWVIDAHHPEDSVALDPFIQERLSANVPVIRLFNKIDTLSDVPQSDENIIYGSAKQGHGLSLLKARIKDVVGYRSSEGLFLARRRHIDALDKAQHYLVSGLEQLTVHRAGELLAEDLRLAHLSLCEITGEFTADDLLGEIFSSFCIGK